MYHEVAHHVNPSAADLESGSSSNGVNNGATSAVGSKAYHTQEGRQAFLAQPLPTHDDEVDDDEEAVVFATSSSNASHVSVAPSSPGKTTPRNSKFTTHVSATSAAAAAHQQADASDREERNSSPVDRMQEADL